MTKIITPVSQKGGVGKTSTIQNLASVLSENHTVFLIDFDPQGNLTQGYGIDPYEDNMPTVLDVLLKRATLADVAKVLNDNMVVAPANLLLANAELNVNQTEGKEWHLKQAIEPLVERVDYILIDVPPSLGFLTTNALYCSTHYFIPLQLHPYAFYAIDGIEAIVETMNERTHGGRSEPIEFLGALITMYDPRSNLASSIEELVVNHFNGKTFDTRVPQNIKVAEATSMGESVITYEPQCKGAVAYRNFANEVMARVKK